MKFKWILVGLVAATGMMSLGAGEPTTKPAGNPGNTMPSERRQLSISRSDVIWEVKVKPGEGVKKGQLLVQLDSREEEKKLEIYKLGAESPAEVNGAKVQLEASKVILESKKVEFQRITEMYDNHVATVSEFEKAKLEVETAKLQIDKSEWDLKKAEMEHLQQAMQYELQKATVDRMRIYSPVDGLVEDVLLKEGEVVDPSKPVVIVVKNDVLWVEAFLPTVTTLGMKEGQEVKLKYDFEETMRTGKVIWMNPEAVKGSTKRLIRLELSNPENRPAGMPVTVYP
jgi:HlyD family secretion protein